MGLSAWFSIAFGGTWLFPLNLAGSYKSPWHGRGILALSHRPSPCLPATRRGPPFPPALELEALPKVRCKPKQQICPPQAQAQGKQGRESSHELWRSQGMEPFQEEPLRARWASTDVLGRRWGFILYPFTTSPSTFSHKEKLSFA